MAQFLGGEARGVVTGAGPAVAVDAACEMTELAVEQLVRSNAASRQAYLPKETSGKRTSR